jgi:hypothetical protein
VSADCLLQKVVCLRTVCYGRWCVCVLFVTEDGVSADTNPVRSSVTEVGNFEKRSGYIYCPYFAIGQTAHNRVIPRLSTCVAVATCRGQFCL